jgi:N-methylhydantoinase A
VTDADVVLGVLPDGARLGGSVGLDRRLAEAAVQRVGATLDLDVVETALGIRRVAHAGIVGALRVVSVERGLDPRELTLLAYGGAGGMHACAVADELGMTRILAPAAAGVLSALGLAVSDRRRDHVRPHLAVLDGATAAGLQEAFAALERDVVADLPAARLRRRADLRYRGQSFELVVDGDDAAALRTAFGDAHEARYGWRADDDVEVVAVRVVAVVPGEPAVLRAATEADEPEPGRRRVRLDDGWRELPVLRRRTLRVGTRLDGPLIVELPETTLLVTAGWRGVVDEAGNTLLEHT